MGDAQIIANRGRDGAEAVAGAEVAARVDVLAADQHRRVLAGVVGRQIGRAHV